MADIIFIPVSGVLPKEGSCVIGVGGVITNQIKTPDENQLWLASGYDARFDTRIIEGIKTRA